MKRRHFIESVILACGVLLMPLHITAEETTQPAINKETPSAMASASKHDKHINTDAAAPGTDSSQAFADRASRGYPLDCRFTPDETYAVTDAICQ